MWYRKVLCYEKKKKKENTKILRKQIALVSRANDMSEPCRAILSPPPPPPPPTSDQYNIPNKLRFQLFDNDVPS